MNRVAAAALLPFALLLAVLPFPGTVALRLLLLATAAALGLRLWLRLPHERPALPCKVTLAAWIAVCSASLAYSTVPEYSFGEFKNEIGYTMLAFLSFLVVARDRATVEKLLLGLAAGFAVIGAWAIGTWLRHDFVWNETAGHGGVAAFATYIVTAVPALFWLVRAASRPALRRFARVLLALALVLALATLQRAVWPALVAEGVAVVVWRFRLRRFGRRELALVALAVVVATAAFLAVIVQRDAGLAEDSRLPAWRNMVAKIAEHPVVGAGFGRFTMEDAYPELVPKNNPLITHPHNVFLTYAIGMGVPGAIVLAALFLCLALRFAALLRHDDENLALLGACGLMLVAGVVVRNQFNDMFVRDMALLFWALAGTFLGLSGRLAARPPT